MVYISSSGQLQGDQGWSLQKLKRTFWNFVDGFLLFFQTLIPINTINPRGQRYVTQYGPSGATTQRRIGRPGAVSGVAAPPCAPGGG